MGAQGAGGRWLDTVGLGAATGERPGAAGLDYWSQWRRTQCPGHTKMRGNQKKVEGCVHGGEIERTMVATLNCLHMVVEQ